jgi:NAD(P)-dependent dehydrogenase (short-subunit alcohol dehydrogenase family)
MTSPKPPAPRQPRTSPVCIVVGAGPGLGASVARRFARESYAVALLARSNETLAPLVSEIRAAGSSECVAFAADATNAASMSHACAQVSESLGAPSVLVYNAASFTMGSILDVSPERFEECWKACCFGGYLAAREVLPAMIERGSGTILFTGATASIRGGARFAPFAVGKFGLRALAQSLARELGPRGIHVAHVIIDGPIDTARVRGIMPDLKSEALLSPDAIAETYFQLAAQHPSAWTHELDLRPASEKF